MAGLSGSRSRGGWYRLTAQWLGGSQVAPGAVVSPHDDGDAADGGSIAA